MATTTKKPRTAEELDRLPEGWRYEIDEGELVIMAPAGWRHNRSVSRIARLLGNFVEAHRLGEVVTNALGFSSRSLRKPFRPPRDWWRGYSAAPGARALHPEPGAHHPVTA